MVTANAGPGPQLSKVSPASAGPSARPAVNDSDTKRTADKRSSGGTNSTVIAWVGAHWNPDATPTTTWMPIISHGVRRSAVNSAKNTAEQASWVKNDPNKRALRLIRSLQIPATGVMNSDGISTANAELPTHQFESVSWFM